MRSLCIVCQVSAPDAALCSSCPAVDVDVVDGLMDEMDAVSLEQLVTDMDASVTHNAAKARRRERIRRRFDRLAAHASHGGHVLDRTSVLIQRTRCDMVVKALAGGL